MPTSSPIISTSTRCTPIPVFLRSVCFIETRLMSLGTSPRLFTSFMMGLSAFSLFSVRDCASGSWYALVTRKMLCPWLTTATSYMWQMSQYQKEERKWCCLIKQESYRKRGQRHWMSLATGLRMISSLRLPQAWQQRTCYLTTSYQQGYCLLGSWISKGTMSAWQSLRPVLLSTSMSLTYSVYLMAICMSASTIWSTEEGRRVGSAKSIGQWYSLPACSPSSLSPVASSIWYRTLQPSRKQSPSFCCSSFMSSRVRVRAYSSNFLDYPISTFISSFWSEAFRMSSVSMRGGDGGEREWTRPMLWMCEYPRSYTSTGALASSCFGVRRRAAERRGCWV